MWRKSLPTIVILTGLWLVLLAGLGALPDDDAVRPLRYAHTGSWTLYQDPSGQASVAIRDLRAI